MILIKDRHNKTKRPWDYVIKIGKYDTYKGSTLTIRKSSTLIALRGKYDTYKGSTLLRLLVLAPHFYGKYDTYKGSTLFSVI